jgi:hypothetical protein
VPILNEIDCVIILKDTHLAGIHNVLCSGCSTIKGQIYGTAFDGGGVVHIPAEAHTIAKHSSALICWYLSAVHTGFNSRVYIRCSA